MPPAPGGRPQQYPPGRPPTPRPQVAQAGLAARRPADRSTSFIRDADLQQLPVVEMSASTVSGPLRLGQLVRRPASPAPPWRRPTWPRLVERPAQTGVQATTSLIEQQHVAVREQQPPEHRPQVGLAAGQRDQHRQQQRRVPWASATCASSRPDRGSAPGRWRRLPRTTDPGTGPDPGGTGTAPPLPRRRPLLVLGQGLSTSQPSCTRPRRRPHEPGGHLQQHRLARARGPTAPAAAPARPAARHAPWTTPLH